MKLLSGKDLAGFIKTRQADQVAQLGFEPRLAIIQTVDNPVITTYVKAKQRYGDDIGVAVDIYDIKQDEVPATLERLNNDESVNGIIVQLPLEDPSATDEILNLVDASKDVDGLASKTNFDPATPTAILWLLAGYNIDLKSKKVAILGQGPLVGAPLERILTQSGVSVIAVGRENQKEALKHAEVIISATGQSGLITSDMVPKDAVIIDAGVASESGKTTGDVADDVYGREDVSITPKKGGVGPLTVCALFENVIKSARAKA